MAKRYVALLRGVNVGGSNKLAMAELRRLLEELGYGDVATLIQSGNAVFSAPRTVRADDLRTAIAERFGLDVAVVVRSGPEMAAVVAANPFPDADTKALHVGFMTAAPDPAAVAALDASSFSPEDFAVVGAEVYFHLPSGMARTKLPGYVGRGLGLPTTVRNWNTVTRLAEMAG